MKHSLYSIQRILLNLFVLFSIAYLDLEEHGINTDTCNGIEEALILIEENSYDMVLIDQQLSNLKIIMVDQVKKEVVEVKPYGFIDEFIEKPVYVNVIIDMIYRIHNLKKM
ncbi:hypothetical protein [Terrisporobacter vanillatitrophus]|uniref:hypothetical protein n=1 Tax=Terrisporobacter vanillatitrophus TaxID=3058402 RepID=UPI003367C8D9